LVLWFPVVPLPLSMQQCGDGKHNTDMKTLPAPKPIKKMSGLELSECTVLFSRLLSEIEQFETHTPVPAGIKDSIDKYYSQLCEEADRRVYI